MHTFSQLAQALSFPDSTNGTSSLTGPLKSDGTLGSLFTLNGGNLLNVIVFIAGIVLLGYILIGGYKYLTAQGDPKAVDSAKNTLTYAFIGFAIVALAYLVFQVAELFFGFKILSHHEVIPSAYAEGVDIGDNLKLGGGTVKQNFGSVGALVSRVLSFAIPLAGVVFLVMLVVGGLRWVSSQGDKAALQSARGTLTTAAIGLVIVVSSFLVLQVIQLITGFNVGAGGTP